MSTTPDRPLPLPGLLRCLQPREFPRKLGICDRLFGRALAGAGICWVRTAPGPVWKLDLGNQTHRWIVYGSYEGPAFWHWLRRDGAGTRTIVDSGANIGQTVLYFASLLPAARIFAYEPGSAARARKARDGPRAIPARRRPVRPDRAGTASARAAPVSAARSARRRRASPCRAPGRWRRTARRSLPPCRPRGCASSARTPRRWWGPG